MQITRKQTNFPYLALALRQQKNNDIIKMVDIQIGHTHAQFYCKARSRSKVTEEGLNLPPFPPLVLKCPQKPIKNRINALHKTNHVISYSDIRMQNPAWSRMVSEDRLYFPYFRKSVITHSTIYNNDGLQETLTGSGTRHQ